MTTACLFPSGLSKPHQTQLPPRASLLRAFLGLLPTSNKTQGNMALLATPATQIATKATWQTARLPEGSLLLC